MVYGLYGCIVYALYRMYAIDASQLHGGRDEASQLYGCMQVLHTAEYSRYRHTPKLTAYSHTRLRSDLFVMDTAVDVPSFLKAHGLEQFAHKVVDLGYDSVQLLFALEPREVDELIKNAGMLSGFAVKMRRALLSTDSNDAVKEGCAGGGGLGSSRASPAI